MALGPEQKVTNLIAAGQYGDLAPQLDDIELQVNCMKLKIAPLGPDCKQVLVCLQTADLDQWPHALQLLGHIYNGNLYVCPCCVMQRHVVAPFEQILSQFRFCSEDARFVWKRASNTHKQVHPCNMLSRLLCILMHQRCCAHLAEW